MDNSFVALVILVEEKSGPVGRQRVGVDSEAVILSSDEATLCITVSTRLVMSSVTITGKERNYNKAQAPK